MKNHWELTSFQVKGFAILAMLIDHIAWLFVPTLSFHGFAMHLIGRITAPTMSFFLVEGYLHTKKLSRYAMRLAIFAIISYCPYILFSTGALPTWETAGKWNVLYTLFLSLLALVIWDRVCSIPLRLGLIAGLCVLSIWGDWSYFMILFTLSFYLGHGNFSQQARYFSLSAVIWVAYNVSFYFLSLTDGTSLSLSGFFCGPGIQLGVFLCLPLLSRYHGKRGGGKRSGWLFYLFYPTHLLILYLIWAWVRGLWY